MKCHELLLVVGLISRGDVEEALRILSEAFNVRRPAVKIGLPKRCYKAYACFVPGKWTIFFRDGEAYRNPFIVLHEFYHAVRFKMSKHRGTERLADKFAEEMLTAAARCVETG